MRALLEEAFRRNAELRMQTLNHVESGNFEPIAFRHTPLRRHQRLDFLQRSAIVCIRPIGLMSIACLANRLRINRGVLLVRPNEPNVSHSIWVIHHDAMCWRRY
jgi:hypothetical protein